MPKVIKNNRVQGTKDGKGIVIVKLFLLRQPVNGHHTVQGNITKSIRLDDAKVSEVYKKILNLFEGDE